MRLLHFALLTDENIGPSIVRFLRDRGFNVLDAKEEGLIGRTDLELVRTAYAQERVIVTHDRDFGRIGVDLSEPLIGVIYLRPGHISPQFTIASLEAVLVRDLDFEPPFIVVIERTTTEVRIRCSRSRSRGEE